MREILKQGTASHLRVRAFANENLTPEEIATKYGHLGCAAGMKKWQARTEGFCKSDTTNTDTAKQRSAEIGPLIRAFSL